MSDPQTKIEIEADAVDEIVTKVVDAKEQQMKNNSQDPNKVEDNSFAFSVTGDLAGGHDHLFQKESVSNSPMTPGNATATISEQPT